MQVSVILHGTSPARERSDSAGSATSRCVTVNADGSIDVMKDAKHMLHHDSISFDAIYDETASPREVYADQVQMLTRSLDVRVGKYRYITK